MASSILKLQSQTLRSAGHPNPFLQQKTHPWTLSFPKKHSHQPLHLTEKPIIPSLQIQSSLSTPSTPPTSKEDAILQAKACLSTTLQKSLNNPKLVGKLKKVRQPRYQVEIPVTDDSPTFLTQLAYEIFKNIPIRRKSLPFKILIVWPSPALKDSAIEAFQSHSLDNIEHSDISSVTDGGKRILSSADVTVFLAPESSQLTVIKTVVDSLYPRPVVIFNPRWGFEEENDFGDLNGFVSSFEVIYSFVGLEVRGVLSKRKGAVFRCVRDGVVSGEKWAVLVEDERELKVVSRFKARPSIGDVESVLYNLMAINSPITKSAKFLRDLVSNVTGRK
uniref:Uncharacterized protein MANES_03G122200 n=1 Tax=Rhizophora mucronata TaxID=61149 RepID=A0A2P2NL91_RHIMU